MLIYLVIFFLVAYLAYQNNNENKKDFFTFFGVCISLGLFVGLADMLGGYDRYIYGDVFTTFSQEEWLNVPMVLSLKSPYFTTEIGYQLWNIFIGTYTPNRYIFILVTSLFMYTLLAINLYRFTRNPYWGLLIFMALMFFFTFTYLRQVMAAMIVWNAIPYARNRNMFMFGLFVFIASLFHNSAIIFSALYFMPLKKIDIRIIIGVMIGLFFLGLLNISSSMFSSYGDIVEQAGDRSQQYIRSDYSSFRIEYLLESVFFLYVLLKNYSKLDFDNPRLVVLINSYLLFCGVLLLFVKNSQGGRLSWYFLMGVFTVPPYIMTKYKESNLQSLFLVMTFALYFRILISWGILLSPYKTFLTPGVRKGDPIYLKYEYDENYTKDKLYNL